MKLLKSLSLMSLALLFTLAFSCEQKAASEGEAEATEEVEAPKVEEAPAAEETMEMTDSTAAPADSVAMEATEAIDSASMEN